MFRHRLASARAIALGLAALVLVALPGVAAETQAPASKLPPILDRELFFGDPEISGAQLSPDGKFISFIKPLDGTRNIWIKKVDEPFEKARPLTAETKRPIPVHFWSRDAKLVLWVQDKGGDENFNVYAVDPNAKVPEGAKVPPARSITNAEGARAQIYGLPKVDPDAMFVGLNDRDPAWFDLYRVKLSTGERTLLRQNDDRVSSWIFDLAGTLRLASRIDDKGNTEVLRVDADGLVPVYSCSVFESCSPVRFHKDGKRVYMITNRGADVDLIRLVLFDPATGKEEVVESDPEKRVDFGGPIFSDKTDELIATTYEDDRTRIYFRDKAFEADFRLLESKLPGKEISPASSTADERFWLIAAGSDTEPGERHLFDRKTKKLTFQYRAFEELPREHLAPMKAIRYKSSDGLEIPAFLTLPKGVPAEKLPLLVFPHGGPWARDAWGYDAYAQFFANRGFAVLQPNFRGSTGYGKKFLNAGNGQWGQTMQDDLTWGVKHLVEKGIADPKKAAIMGGSYGGYAALAGVAFTPDVYAAAVSIVGPSNLITLLDSIPPYWEAIRTVFHTRMANPNTPEGKALLMKQSPLNSAQKIKTPLFVVQGANDPRVKQAESDQIVVALRDRGFPVEYMVAPDEGHGFQRPVNNMAMIAAAERFFNKHVGTRYQADMTEEVAKRLVEITVDPKTVTLAKPVDTSAAAPATPVAELVAGTFRYQQKLAVAGQELDLPLVRTIAQEGEEWVITDALTTPQGPAEDVTRVAKGTLQPKSRTVTQGPLALQMTYDGAKVSGSMAMGGQSRPIDVDLGGTAFADGAGAPDVIARLPLAAGYETLARTLDLQTLKAKVNSIKVTGEESVTVPAGTFETFKVELASAEGDPGGMTMWIAKESRQPVKWTATLPQMGGAVLTAELLP